MIPGRVLLLTLVACLLAAGCASKQSLAEGEPRRALEPDGRVEVSWSDPSGYTERLRSQGRPGWEDRERTVKELAMHLREAVEKHSPPGGRLEIQVLDLALAGAYEVPIGTSAVDVRILRETYPPMMELRVLRGAGAEPQTFRLLDAAYLSRAQGRYPRDELRHEKRMIDDWAAREFGALSR